MNNFKKLGLVLSVGTIAAFSLVGCGDDDDSTTTTGGTAPVAGTTSTGGGGSGSIAGSTSTGGGGTGTVAGSTSTGGGGASATGGGGSGGKASGGSGGTGGASGGTGGASGGSGGTGGASGGSGGSGGAAPSAACMTWCVGDNSVVTVCAANALPDKISTSDKCLAECAKSPADSVTCWNMHVANAKAGDKATHCPHGEGADGQAICPKLP